MKFFDKLDENGEKAKNYKHLQNKKNWVGN